MTVIRALKRLIELMDVRIDLTGLSRVLPDARYLRRQSRAGVRYSSERSMERSWTSSKS